MNTLKVLVATLGTAIVLSLLGTWSLPNISILLFLAVSGIIGLAIGDLCLLHSFSVLGPGRTLVLFGLHPLMVGLYDYLFFSITLPWSISFGVVLMIACLLIFMHERWHETGRWEFKSFGLALFAVFLDATGILLSKMAFKTDDTLTSWQANFWRSLAATGFLLISGRLAGQYLLDGFFKLKIQERASALWASTYGTFLSLSFFFLALSYKGPLSAISAVTITGPIVASGLECLQNKKRPSRHLMFALIIFPFGLFLLARQ